MSAGAVLELVTTGAVVVVSAGSVVGAEVVDEDAVVVGAVVVVGGCVPVIVVEAGADVVVGTAPSPDDPHAVAMIIRVAVASAEKVCRMATTLVPTESDLGTAPAVASTSR